jgi:Ca2+-binding RTX toxin-like protein
MPTLDLSNYTLTFVDNFDTRSISQTGASTTWADIRKEWRFDANSDIGFGKSSFVDPASGYDPFSYHDGLLTITAVQDRTPYGYPTVWESGLITTQNGFNQTYGYFEIRADFSNATGAWGAFWLMPVNPIADKYGNNQHQELDVVENYGAYDNGVYSHIHTTDPVPNLTWQRDLQVVSDLATVPGFHTFGMDWGPTTIAFYVDGKFVGSQATPTDMHGPMYLLANLATTTDSRNNVDLTTGPISMDIDYIKVYARPGAAPATPAAVNGQAGDDLLRGGDAQDVINGQAGNDTVFGGEGNDLIHGNEGADYLRGDDGVDTILGDAGNDDINGNKGNDLLNGGVGDDWVVGGQGDDTLDGGDGFDIVYGNLGKDNLSGGSGNDWLRGGQDDDTLAGGDGDDWLWGDRGADILTGGNGADVFHISASSGADRITDFNRAAGDRIVIDDHVAYTLGQSGADTVITLASGDAAVLVGVTLSSLGADWLAQA